MAAAVSQLCVRQGNRHLDWFIQLKGCKVEQISPLFQVQKSSFPCRFVGFFTQYLYGRLTCVIAEKEKSTSEILRFFLP